MMGPQLHTVYNTRRTERTGSHTQDRIELYKPNSLEKIGDTVIRGLYTIGHVGLYSTLIWVPVLSYFCSYYTTLKVGGLMVPCLVGMGMAFRGLGRWSNPTYIEFLRILSSIDPDKKPSQKTMKILRQYDFDFSEWPVNFEWSDVPEDERIKCRFHEYQQQREEFFTRIIDLPS